MTTKINHLDSPLTHVAGGKVAIIRTKWYREYTDSMVDRCIELLLEAGCEKPVVHTVPGAFELPLAAQTVVTSDPELEAIICFGGIVKGGTLHFEMISHECIRGISQVMLEMDIPIIFEVLAVNNIEDLAERSGNDHRNKGIEAAYATTEMIAWRRSLE